jgi:hypothetical protein
LHGWILRKEYDAQPIRDKRVLLAWQLLDRLVEDDEITNTMDMTDLLNRVLTLWRWHTRQQQDASLTLQAMQVLKASKQIILESYCPISSRIA